MKKLILLMVFLILGSCNFAHAQTVNVSQSFVDDCTKAFNLVIEQRDALEKFKIERAKNDVERASADALIKGLNEFVALKDRTISQYELLVQMQQKIISFQQGIITKLQEMLKKPKSFLDKVLKVLKEVALLAGGVLLGRGLAGL